MKALKNYFIDMNVIQYNKGIISRKMVFEVIDFSICNEDRSKVIWLINKEVNLSACWNDNFVRMSALLPIYKVLKERADKAGKYSSSAYDTFTKRSLRNLFNWFGSTEQGIIDEIYSFFSSEPDTILLHSFFIDDVLTGIDILFTKAGFYPPHHFVDYWKDLLQECFELTGYDRELFEKLDNHQAYPQKKYNDWSLTTFERAALAVEIKQFLDKFRILK